MPDENDVADDSSVAEKVTHLYLRGPLPPRAGDVWCFPCVAVHQDYLARNTDAQEKARKMYERGVANHLDFIIFDIPDLPEHPIFKAVTWGLTYIFPQFPSALPLCWHHAQAMAQTNLPAQERSPYPSLIPGKAHEVPKGFTR